MRSTPLLVAATSMALTIACGGSSSGSTDGSVTDAGTGGTEAGSTGGAQGTGGAGGTSGADGAAGSSSGGALHTGGTADAGSGEDAGALDAGPADAGDAGPCATAAEGAPCAVEGTSCGGGCTDPCQFCHVFQCVGGKWSGMEVFPAPCFDCGPDRRCQDTAQYCDVQRSDVVGQPDVYSCATTPDACKTDATCACIQAVVASDACTAANPGQVTIEHFGG